MKMAMSGNVPVVPCLALREVGVRYRDTTSTIVFSTFRTPINTFLRLKNGQYNPF